MELTMNKRRTKRKIVGQNKNKKQLNEIKDFFLRPIFMNLFTTKVRL